MDTLISLGTLAAFGWSLYALFFGTAGEPGMRTRSSFTVGAPTAAGNIYLEAAAGVTTFILAGRYFEARAKRARRRGAARAARARRQGRRGAPRPASRRAIPIDQLAVGDVFVVRPGEKIATDGVVVEGAVRGRRVACSPASACRSRSVRATRSPAPPSTPAAGCVVRATRIGADTQLAQMARLVEEAQNGKAEVQRLADRISGVFVPIVIALAVGTLGFWLGTGGGDGRGVHRRRRRADHRLPLRARPGHADRAAWSAPAGARSSAS